MTQLDRRRKDSSGISPQAGVPGVKASSEGKRDALGVCGDDEGRLGRRLCLGSTMPRRKLAQLDVTRNLLPPAHAPGVPRRPASA